MDSPADPAPIPAPTWLLKPVAVTGCAQRIAVANDVALGRAPSNTVVLSEADYPHVSAHHARLVPGADGSLRVEDLASRNGTFVNGQRVQQALLRPGDLLRLGDHGPQFVVEHDAESQRTAVLGATAIARAAAAAVPVPAEPVRPPLTQTTIARVKRALGVPEDADIGHLVADSEHRLGRRLAITVLALAACTATVLLVARSLQQREIDQLAAVNAELRAQLQTASGAFEQQTREWTESRGRLESDRLSLQQRIELLTNREQGSQVELVELRRALEQTNQRLASYDPLVVERLRLTEVARVQRAVVFVQTRLRLRSSKNGKLLRERGASMTFGDDGDVYERDSSGSGFCIGADGSIVTNAHVVWPEGHDTNIELGPGDFLRPELEHVIVFTGSDRQLPAQLVKVLEQGDDLALLRIEPFAGMPFLEDFDTAAAVPDTGAEVYLHGFPFGTQAIQDGRRVVASSFRGILSRTVSNWLQVDAAVHPGNSGGPLTDRAGKVIGVVTRVQRISATAIAPDMGYAIPIAAVARLLPPRVPAAGPLPDGATVPAGPVEAASPGVATPQPSGAATPQPPVGATPQQPDGRQRR